MTGIPQGGTRHLAAHKFPAKLSQIVADLTAVQTANCLTFRRKMAVRDGISCLCVEAKTPNG